MDHASFLGLSQELSEAALKGADEAKLIETFCHRVQAAGMPLFRGFVGVDTLHPVVDGVTYEWRRTRDQIAITLYERATSDEREDSWHASPLYRVYAEGNRMLRRRVGDTHRPGEFPVIDDLVAEGATDYLCWAILFTDSVTASEEDGFYASLASDRPGGFTEAEVACLDRLMSGLALAMRTALLVRTTESLLSTYLGADPGQRILRGQIERGAAEALSSVLWFSDLRGFTRIGDTTPDALLPLLNDYAECLVTAVHEQAGQVLKFVGDGLLAIFPIRPQDPESGPAACRRALAAADQARRDVSGLNIRRSADGAPVTTFYLGLHVGEVYYGNIGSPTRLDFTVVGPAVNEVSRIGGLCRALDQDVIVSKAFAAAGGDPGRLSSLGLHSLRGVSRPQELFGLMPVPGGMASSLTADAISATK